MNITTDVIYIGVNDRELDLFEGQYAVPNGMAYNSYVILDEKIAVLDTVDARFGAEWLSNLKNALGNRRPDYLIVHHMEPDHSANIKTFKDAYPDATVVATDKAFRMMKQFFGTDYSENRLVVGEGDELALGQHNLTFLMAPMVHWPEVMLSYDRKDRILFSADAFGKFGALDAEEDWACEARRYYIGIVGKYGTQVQALLKKIVSFEIQMICPLHGPVLKEDLSYHLNLYHIWSSYQPEEKGVMIAYTSVYGNTKQAVEYLAEALEKNGCEKVVLNDLARCDMAEAVEDAFRYDRIVLATTTYNGDVFPFMKEFLHHLAQRNFRNRKVGLMENGSWAPVAAKKMKDELATCSNLEFAPTAVKILSAVNFESREQIEALAKELTEEVKE